jgi:hypothetical protein
METTPEERDSPRPQTVYLAEKPEAQAHYYHAAEEHIPGAKPVDKETDYGCQYSGLEAAKSECQRDQRIRPAEFFSNRIENSGETLKESSAEVELDDGTGDEYPPAVEYLSP